MINIPRFPLVSCVFQAHSPLINRLSIYSSINTLRNGHFVQKRLISDGEIVVRTKAKVRLLGINRPDKNYLNLNIIQQLKKEIEKFDSDDTSNIAVIYGEMGNFSSGIDENDILKDQKLLENIDKHVCDIKSDKILVAAISGFAIGHAFDLALSCDFVIMEDTAVFSTYNKRSSITTSRNQIERLNKLFGNRKTLDWVMTGRHISAKESLETGIASRIVACGTGLGQAVSFANGLSTIDQKVLRNNKKFINSLLQ